MNEETLFAEVLKCGDPAQRVAFLEQACGADVELRRRIEELLRAHDQAGGLLDKPAATLEGTSDALPGQWLDADKLPETPSEGVGSRINEYKLLQQIGEGGMGVVFMAEQQEPVRRMVALKVIKAGMDSAQVIARFEQERQALALMDHPNIAKVLDAGTTQSGRPFFVMELVKGIPITKYCDEQQLSPKQRLELFVPVCQAIQHAHQKGIIHRDIKPSNVLIAAYDGKPVPKVIDFGVAKATGQKLTERTLFTGFGGLVGTLEYMSPEQAEFNALDIDTRSDVYSLGVLLYELLTGSTPLSRQRIKDAAILEVLRLIREEEPPRPSTRLSDSKDSLASVSAQRHMEPAGLVKAVRGEMDWLVMKALEKDRTRRYETANGLARDIARYLAEEPIEAGPPSATYRLRKMAWKHRRGLATAAALVFLLAAGVVVSTILAVWARRAELRAEDNASVARRNEEHAKKERDAAEITSNKLRNILYISDMNLVQAAWEANHVSRVLELLDRHRSHSGESELRGFEWYYWQRQSHAELSKATIPDLGRCISASDLLSCGGAFDRDGARLAAVVQTDKFGVGGDPRLLYELRIWDSASGAEQFVIPGLHPYGLNTVALSPREDLLTIRVSPAVGIPYSTLKVWDMRGRKEIIGIPWGNACTFSPDGKRLAVSIRRKSASQTRDEGEIALWDLDARKQLFARPASDRVSHLAFSPDGARLAIAVSGFDNNREPLEASIRTWDAESGQELRAIRLPPNSFLDSMDFSPDGTRIAAIVSSGDFPRCLIQTWDAASGKELSTFPCPYSSLASPSKQLRFSPDGRLLAVWSLYDSSVTLLDPEAGIDRFTVKGHTGRLLAVGFSRDGRRLFTASLDGTVKTWNIALPAENHRRKRVSVRPPDLVAIDSSGTRFVVDPVERPNRNRIRVLDRGGKEIISLAVPKGNSLFGAEFSPDGRRLAAVLEKTAGGKRDYQLTAWNIITGETVLTRPLGEDVYFGAQTIFSPDGRRIAKIFYPQNRGNPLATTSGVKVWDSDSGEELLTLEPRSATGRLRALAFHPDNTRIAAQSVEGDVKIWDIATGREILALNASGTRYCHYPNIAFSPDGRTLLANFGRVHEPGVLRAWDADTGAKLFVLTGHTGPIRGLAFSPDGRRIASVGFRLSGAEGEMKLWDAGSGQELLSLKQQGSAWREVRFSADGRRLIAFGYSLLAANYLGIEVLDATPVPER